MKRTDIRAGVVYAVKSSYGQPTPVVFLEDGAAGLYKREPYGKQGIRKLAEDKYTKAKRGSGWSETTRGYAAITAGSNANPEAADLLGAIDPEAELARFVADERPSVEGLQFSIRYTLSDISGPYADEKAAHDAQQEAEREARRREQAENKAARDRADAITGQLSAFGVDGEAVNKDRSRWSHICISVADAEKLLALLAAKEA